VRASFSCIVGEGSKSEECMELDITYIDKQLYHRELRGGLGRGHSFLLFATILSSELIVIYA
jgi:hypothetical protein